MRSATVTCSVTAGVFFSSSIPSLLQRKILFEVLGHGASKQNYNLKHKVPATCISLCLFKVMNSNAIISKRMIKINNELSVSSAFLEDWWDNLQNEAVKSWSKNTYIIILKSMHIPEMFSNRQCALSKALCWLISEPTESEFKCECARVELQ